MLSDIEIAQQNKMEKIQVIADKCGLTADDIEQYGHYKAKISFDAFVDLSRNRTESLFS
nr:formate--tetrahydrofolate ligase [Veillonella denticariosi]